jgi:hypothetical protein
MANRTGPMNSQLEAGRWGFVAPHPCDSLFLEKPSHGWSTGLLWGIGAGAVLALGGLAGGSAIHAQAQAVDAAPIAIVPLDSKNPDKAAKVTGALEVSQGRAVIVTSGSVTAGADTTQVTLPHRGVLRVCASTTVKLAADSSVPAGETPGLMMAMDHGAIEASFATGRNSDILLTPDFRILIGGPGAAEVKVRLGQHGDTCVDNDKASAAYVLVTSDFGAGVYRVQAGQHVMFERGSLTEVVDNEKEPCGCPPALHPGTNEFPLAQSAGLAPTPQPAPSAVTIDPNGAHPQPIEPLVYKSDDHAPQPAADTAPAANSDATAKPPAEKKKPGFFARIKKALRQVFGAE